MGTAIRAVLMLGLLACAVACGAATGASDDVYAQGAYEGRVTAQVLEPGAARDPKRDAGTGTAQFIAIGNGRSRLVVKGNIREPGDTGFVMEGNQRASGWSGRTGNLSLVIDGNGNISGGGIENRHRIVFGGRATAERMDLTVETVKLAQTEQGVMPAGTRIVFDYDLGRTHENTRRAATTATPVKKAQNAPGTCKRRVWRTRNVTTPGGGMHMVQVPHCVN